MIAILILQYFKDIKWCKLLKRIVGFIGWIEKYRCLQSMKPIYPGQRLGGHRNWSGIVWSFCWMVVLFLWFSQFLQSLNSSRLWCGSRPFQQYQESVFCPQPRAVPAPSEATLRLLPIFSWAGDDIPGSGKLSTAVSVQTLGFPLSGH